MEPLNRDDWIYLTAAFGITALVMALAFVVMH